MELKFINAILNLKKKQFNQSLISNKYNIIYSTIFYCINEYAHVNNVK